MRIHITTAPKRKKPRAGDRKMIKGVEHVRVHERAACGAIVKNGGRYCYKWVPVSDAMPHELLRL